jgi:hypothetical protein
MIVLSLVIIGAILAVCRHEAAELLTICAFAIIRRRNSSLDRLLPARRRPGYRLALR